MAATTVKSIRVKITIEPQNEQTELAPFHVQYDAIFSRAVQVSEGPVPGPSAEEPPKKYVVVRDTLRFELDDKFRDSPTLNNAVPGNPILLNFLFPDGRPIIKREISVPSDLTSDFNAPKIVLSSDEITKLLQLPGEPEKIPSLLRRPAVLVSIYAKTPIDFSKALLQVVPIEFNTTISWVDGGFSKLFGNEQSPITGSVVLSSALPQRIASLSWAITRVAVDGSFVATFQAGKWTAWAWLLSGPALQQPILGVVIETLKEKEERTRSILLPLIGKKDSGQDTPEAGQLEHQSPGTGTIGSTNCSCDSHESARKPVDVSESELAANPDVYTEDPGAFCKPFSAPQRVLSERSFFSIIRAEQPVISSEASINLREPAQLDFDPPDELLDSINSEPTSGVLRSLLLDGATARTLSATSRSIGDLSGLIAGIEDKTTLINGSVLRNKVRSGLELVVDSIPGALVDRLNGLNRGRRELTAEHPVQWDSESIRYQATTVSRGHILEFRVRTRSNGYSLGGVSKTLTLAPRQTKRIQKIEWSRSERAIRSESQRTSNAVNDSMVHDTSYSDVVSANLREWAQGSSQSSVTAAAGGAGLALGPFVIGGGVAHSSARSSSQQSGGRDTTAKEEMQWRDAIRRHGDDLRKFDSMVVQEVNQDEEVTGTVEIVRNVNYAHSLTVIYHNILRHLRVDTEFAGVREALFVPFAMKPFTMQRAYRWRETLLKVLRERRFDRPMRHLKDILTGFKYSQIPHGRRADHPLRSLYGSIYIDLGVALPGSTTDGKFDAAKWTTLGGLLGMPALSVFQQVATQVEALREAHFQRHHAPAIARKWCDKLQITTRTGQELAIDFTLATSYAFNRTVRVDFQVNLTDDSLSRASLTSLTIKAGKPLTPGSVANVRSLTYTYQTDYEKRTVAVTEGVGDLVSPENGDFDTLGAILRSPLSQYELQNLRAELVYQTTEMLEHLNEHVEYYHRMIWCNMDRDRLFMLLDGFYVPGMTPQTSIASVVERNPVSAAGNCLIFRVSAGCFVGTPQFKTPDDLYNHYQQHQGVSTPMNIALSTDGLYAQTIMDECVALEEHYGNLDWALNDPDPELGAIDAALLTSRRSNPDTATEPTKMPDTLINLQNALPAPVPQGLAGVLNAVQNSAAFRDMAGLAGTQTLATEGLKTAASLATTFGNQAAALELAQLTSKQQGTMDADKKLASIARARDKGLLVSPEKLEEHTSQVLAQMNGGPTAEESPHTDAVFQSAIDAAKDATGEDRQIEATTAKGAVRVAFAVPVAPSAVLAKLGGTRPHYDQLLAEFPRWDLPENTSPNVKQRIGGQVDKPWVGNTCVVRVSRGLLYTGTVIPQKDSGDELAVPGADGKFYMLRVVGMRKFLTRIWGKPDFDLRKKSGEDFDKAQLENMRGVITWDLTPPPDHQGPGYTGHFDLFDGKNFTQEAIAGGNYWRDATRISLWILL